MHAHFDCFSGAAGDMMLAACCDAHPTLSPEKFLEEIQNRLYQGLCHDNDVQNNKSSVGMKKEEFSIRVNRVWKGMGSIAAWKVSVDSCYGHAAAPAPVKADGKEVVGSGHGSGLCDGHNHDHASSNSHDCSLEDKSHAHNHDHSDNKSNDGHDHSHKQNNDHSNEHDHSHEHSHDHGGEDCNICAEETRNITTAEDVKNIPMPAWKKRALAQQEPQKAEENSAPFGGSWNIESSLTVVPVSSTTPPNKKHKHKEEKTEKINNDHNHSHGNTHVIEKRQDCDDEDHCQHKHEEHKQEENGHDHIHDHDNKKNNNDQNHSHKRKHHGHVHKHEIDDGNKEDGDGHSHAQKQDGNGHGHTHKHNHDKKENNDDKNHSHKQKHHSCDHAQKHNNDNESKEDGDGHSHAHKHGHDHDKKKINGSHLNKQKNHDVDHFQKRNDGSETKIDEDGHDHSHKHNHDHPSQKKSDNLSHNHSHSKHKGPLRNFTQIRSLLLQSDFPPWVRSTSVSAFYVLAQAEALTHGSSVEKVHFHEVGAIDSIVDIVGTVLALYLLGVKTVSTSALPLGQGMVWTDHGLLPVPAPATLRLLKGMTVCPGPPGNTGELVTPTAAALLRTLVGIDDDKKPNSTTASNIFKTISAAVTTLPPTFVIQSIGIGAGTKDFVKHPNILRLMLGECGVDSSATGSSSAMLEGGDENDTTPSSTNCSSNTENNNNNTNFLHSSVVQRFSSCSFPPYARNISTILSNQTNNNDILWKTDNLVQLEANIDDTTPEVLAYTIQKLLSSGALDAWTTPIGMKKGRPAHTLYCLCRTNMDHPHHSPPFVTTIDENQQGEKHESPSSSKLQQLVENKLLEIIFRETTTLGIRIHRNIERASLVRSFHKTYIVVSNTTHVNGFDEDVRKYEINVKVGYLRNDIVTMKPEFEDCRKVAEETGLSLRYISDMAYSRAKLELKQVNSDTTAVNVRVL